MPIYDYDCSSCATRTEFIHGINAPAPRFCPACGAEGTLRKAMVTPAVHFKGSGWAKKDRSSGGDGRTKAGAAASGEAKDGASGATSGSASDASSPAPDASSGSKATTPAGEG